jgi:hypothetical protein
MNQVERAGPTFLRVNETPVHFVQGRPALRIGSEGVWCWGNLYRSRTSIVKRAIFAID